jgi:hypothetical protein
MQGSWENGRFVLASTKDDESARLRADRDTLAAALRDMLAGWKYIRRSHGDLYGVGWDRAQDAAEKALTFRP